VRKERKRERQEEEILTFFLRKKRIIKTRRINANTPKETPTPIPTA